MRGVKLVLTTGIIGLAASVAAIAMAFSVTHAPASQPSAQDGAPALTAQQQQAAAAYAKLPVSFVENRGQTDARVRYYARGNGYAFYMTPSEVMLMFAKQDGATRSDETRDEVALALQFLGSNRTVEPQGADQAPGLINDLRGSDSDQWHSQIPQFRNVVYPDLWPGIDLQLREQSGVLKYEFHVKPGASPSDIRLAYDGADNVGLSSTGGLQISTPIGMLEDSVPLSYQSIGGVQVPVSSHYQLGDDHGFSFAVGSYQRDRELVIDPGVQYATFLGGNSDEKPANIAVDASGNAYIGGTTQSPDFPTTAGAFDRTGATQNFAEAFVTKLNPAGTALVYSTFVGGSDMEFAHGLAIDASGNAYVTGQTKSSNYPTTGGAFDRSLNIPPNCPRCATDNTDNFVFKLNAAGSALVYSTYLGGTEYDAARGIAVDSGGNAYVTGETLSSDYPTTAGAFDRTRTGEYDMFLTKLNPTGSALAYSTFIGGTGVDNGQHVALDSANNAYVVGFTISTDFPTTPGAFDTTANGAFDGTLTKVNSAGSALVYSTYFGGSDFDGGASVTVDGPGSAYVVGGTPSADFPVTPGAYDTTFNNGDAFVTKFNPAGSALVYSTFIGGSSFDSIGSIVLDPAGNAWLGGGTSSADFPVTADATDSTLNGGGDGTITKLNAAGSAILFSTFIGGSQSDGTSDIARGPTDGDIYVTGSTFSQDFPVTVGAFDRVWNGDPTIFWGEAFVAKIDLDATTSTPTAPPAVPGAPTLVSPANASSQPQPVTFDWNTTTSATSYQIQLDDSSAFTAPLVRDQTVTASEYATTSLPTATHFWRVRGVNVAGVAGAWSATRSFTPQAAPPTARLSTLDLNPSTVAGGTESAGTAITDVAATDGGTVTLSSSNPAVASVPATATIAPNGFTATFGVTTVPVASTTSVTITASFNGATRSAVLTVTGGSAPAGPTLQSVTISPSSVAGGSNTSGFVSLSGGAPAAGATVTLSSSNPAVASVPGSVTVASGSTAVGFTVGTTTVSTTTSVTITATYDGISRTSNLSVTAAAPPPPPPTNVTVTVSATGRSGERITSTPAGISVTVGSSGSASFAAGTSVRLTSTRDAVWSGACSSNGQKAKTCTFTALANASVTANVQ
jgi:Beta-propeller repeat